MYDFKIYLPAEVQENNILVFHAWIADSESYYIQDVPHFGIHETYKKLFIDVLNGTLTTKEINIENDNVEYTEKSLPTYGTEINNEYLESCIQFLQNSFGVAVQVESFEMHPMMELRYDAPDMNLEYGISPNISKKIYSFTSDFVDLVQANNTDYGGVLQQQAQAGSTLIPYLSEKIDTRANEIIMRVIDDINNGNIDRDFANSSAQFASLYKKIVKKMSELKQIKDLGTFEIFVYNANGDRIRKNIDLAQVALIGNQLFGDQVQCRGKVRIPAYQLKSRPNIYSATVVIDDKDFTIHLDNQSESFPRLRRILRENEGREVIIDGYKDSEYTIVATHISSNT